MDFFKNSNRHLKRSVAAVVLSLLALAGPAIAEHGCPDGYIPVWQGPRQVCTVDYNLPYWRDQGQPGGNVHVDYYGAAAVAGLDRYWVVWDHASQAEAEAAVMDACRNGGGGSDCELIGWVRNAYMSIASGDAGYFLDFGGYKWLARLKAISACKKHTTGCKHDKTFDVRAWAAGRRPGMYTNMPHVGR